jgi:hypothetical protein
VKHDKKAMDMLRDLTPTELAEAFEELEKQLAEFSLEGFDGPITTH